MLHLSPEGNVRVPEYALLELHVLELDGLPEGDPDLEVLRLQILTNEKRVLRVLTNQRRAIPDPAGTGGSWPMPPPT